MERAARHGTAEGQGGGWEELCRLAMAAKAMAPAAAERRRAKACAREFQREPVDAESSGAQFGGAGREAARGAELGCATAMAGRALCMVATTSFRRTRGARRGARLGGVIGMLAC